MIHDLNGSIKVAIGGLSASSQSAHPWSLLRAWSRGWMP